MVAGFSFLDTPVSVWRAVAKDAWGQHIASEVAHQQDFEGLDGMDLVGFRQAQKQLTYKGLLYGRQRSKNLTPPNLESAELVEWMTPTNIDAFPVKSLHMYMIGIGKSFSFHTL